jgi:hypothetical protein
MVVIVVSDSEKAVRGKRGQKRRKMGSGWTMGIA